MTSKPHLTVVNRVPVSVGASQDFRMMDQCLVGDAVYLREADHSWKAWSAENGRPMPMFNWLSVYNFTVAPTVSLFCIDSGEIGGAEALVMLRDAHVVRCDRGHRPRLVYVGFVEVAPWNDQDYPLRRFRGLGLLVLRLACDLSLQRGFEGRVGLHSVASAEGFYRRLCFESLDCPSEHHEVYFELSATRAWVLLGD